MYYELMSYAYKLATTSPDPSTQNSAIIVPKTILKCTGELDILSEAINCFPDGVKETSERWEKPLKYKIIEHAERNVIYRCAKEGIPLAGTTMVSPWSACTDCARAIIQSGIKFLIRHKQACDKSPPLWKEEIRIANEMLEEAKVTIIELDCKFNNIKIRHSGEIWEP